MVTERRQPSVIRLLSVVGMAIIVMMGGATTAWAGSAEDQDRAETLMFATPIDGFMAAVGESPFNWDSDGCTTPPIKDLAYWNDQFRKSCTRHDFGYRNFGRGGVVQGLVTEPMRLKIDNQFRSDMLDVCKPKSLSKRLECQLVASAYYNVVRKVGRYAFGS